ncbi:MAG: hypothetical protein ABI045_04590 [Flavobacteriales bacterium]
MCIVKDILSFVAILSDPQNRTLIIPNARITSEEVKKFLYRIDF